MARKTYTNSEVQLREQLTSITVDDHGAKIPLSTEYIQQHMYALGLDEERAAAISDEHFETLLYCTLNHQNFAETSSSAASQNPSEDACGGNPR